MMFRCHGEVRGGVLSLFLGRKLAYLHVLGVDNDSNWALVVDPVLHAFFISVVDLDVSNPGGSAILEGAILGLGAVDGLRLDSLHVDYLREGVPVVPSRTCHGRTIDQL